VRRPHRAIAAIALVAISGCSSASSTGARPAPDSTPTTISPSPSGTSPSDAQLNEQLNNIPFDVGEMVGLPGDWQIGVTAVHRPYTAGDLEPLRSGRAYVGVDIDMTYAGEAPRRVDAARLFSLYDDTNAAHRPVKGAGAAVGVNGRYLSGTHRAGRLVFIAPVRLALRLVVEGSMIGSKRSLYNIDPPKEAPHD
jgi:hypothetical protein